jgi:formylglycine-generating enzyme required for sulfatase activity
MMYRGKTLFQVERPAGEILELKVANTRLEMIWCPPGEFMMGSPEDDPFVRSTYKPQIKVRLTQGFWISRYPIIQDLWLLFMGRITIKVMSDGNYPANMMTWNDAKEFCQKLTHHIVSMNKLSSLVKLDLPTEAQWEYACRAGTQTRWHFGDDVSLLKDYAWYADNSNDQVQLTGQKLPNPWGIYDLYGCVSEWCLDNSWHWKKVIETQQVLEDPLYIAPEQRGYQPAKTLRGGDFHDTAAQCCSASTCSMTPINAYNDATGVRVVMTW